MSKIGELNKYIPDALGLIRDKWQPRWFTIEGSKISFKKLKGDKYERGSMELTQCSITNEVTNADVSGDKKGKYYIRISNKKTGEEWRLCATKLDGDEWHNALLYAAQGDSPAPIQRRIDAEEKQDYYRWRNFRVFVLVAVTLITPICFDILSFTYVGCLLVTFMLGTLAWNYFRKIPPHVKARRLEHVSAALAEGAFPRRCKAPQPIINCVLYYDTAPTIEAVKEYICASDLRDYIRMRSVPRFINGHWEWEPRQVIIENHVRHFTVGSEPELNALVQQLYQQSFPDPEVPEWEFLIIENTGEGSSCIIGRVDHSIGDGISFVALTNSLFKDLNGCPLPIQDSYRGARRNSLNIFEQIWDVFSSFFAILTISLFGNDSDIVFSDPAKKALVYTGNRKAIFLPSIDLEYAYAIKEAADCTINDLLMAMTAGAIRRYCLNSNDPAFVTGKTLKFRALLPIAFPRNNYADDEEAKHLYGLTNKWCFLSVPMPIGEDTALERMRTQKKTNCQLKASVIAGLSMMVQELIGALVPGSFVKQTLVNIMSRHSCVFSNVAGPKHPVTFGGQTITAMQVLVANVLPQICVLSYNGVINMNMVLDDKVVLESEKFVQCFQEELQEMAITYDITPMKFGSDIV